MPRSAWMYDAGSSGGREGGKARGTKARTASSVVVDRAVLPVLRVAMMV